MEEGNGAWGIELSVPSAGIKAVNMPVTSYYCGTGIFHLSASGLDKLRWIFF
jgi:hypothetical protein